MKNKPLIIVGIIVIILAIWLVARDHHSSTDTTTATSTSTASGTQTQTVSDQKPGTDEALYGDPSGRFSFIYPKVFSVTGPKSGATTGWREGATSTGYLLATVSVPKSYLPNTNFSDAKLTVGQSTDKAELGSSGCPASLPGYTPGSATAVDINGQTFTKITTSDAAAGNRYDTTGYYTIRDGDCYAVEYTIHYGNIQNYDASSGIKEFDETALTNTLEKVVKSFVFHIQSE